MKAYIPIVGLGLLYLMMSSFFMTYTFGKIEQERIKVENDRSKAVSQLETLCHGSLVEFTIETNKVTAICGE